MPRSVPSAATNNARKSRRLSATARSSNITDTNIRESSSSSSSSESKIARKTRASSTAATSLKPSSNDSLRHKSPSLSPASSNKSYSSSSSHQLQLNADDGPYRRLRSRTATIQNRTQRKRTNSVATDASGSSGKRIKSNLSLRIDARSKTTIRAGQEPEKEEDSAPAEVAESTASNTKSNQVTPSPANSASNSNFNFASPTIHRRRLPNGAVLPFSTAATSSTYPSLPKGVLELYPGKKLSSLEMTKVPNGRQCGQNDCSADSLTASFVQSYGRDYWNHLKENEEPTIADPSPPNPSSSKSGESPASRSSDKSRSSGSPSGAASASAASSGGSSSGSFELRSSATPDQLREYVYVDALSNLEVSQPSESNVFLSYQPELSPKMRSILVDWIIELSEHFHFGCAALHLAVTLVDKVMACGPLTKIYDEDLESSTGNSKGSDSLDDGESKTNCFFISRDRFQLLGASCTWLACKMEELSPPSVSEIAYVSDNIYSTEQIKRMERRICNALNFSLIHPTPFLYTGEFIRASYECPDPSCMAKASPVFHNMVNYLMELVRLPYHPVTQKPSLLTAAAVYAARVTLGVRSSDKTLDPQGRWSRTLQYYTGYAKEDLRQTVQLLHSYHEAAEDSTLKSVFAKYRTKKYLRVALKTVPRLHDYGF